MSRGGFADMGDRYLARKRAGIKHHGLFTGLSNKIDRLLNDNRFNRWFDSRFFDWADGKQTRFQGFITLSILWIFGMMPLWILALLVIFFVIK